jgi:hypothetical protein
MGTTVQKTIEAIVDRSHGVRWQASSGGLALIRERGKGYILVADLKPGDESLVERCTTPREDGRPMEDGHALTPAERERAVRKILGL